MSWFAAAHFSEPEMNLKNHIVSHNEPLNASAVSFRVTGCVNRVFSFFSLYGRIQIESVADSLIAKPYSTPRGNGMSLSVSTHLKEIYCWPTKAGSTRCQGSITDAPVIRRVWNARKDPLAIMGYAIRADHCPFFHCLQFLQCLHLLQFGRNIPKLWCNFFATLLQRLQLYCNLCIYVLFLYTLQLQFCVRFKYASRIFYVYIKMKTKLKTWINLVAILMLFQAISSSYPLTKGSFLWIMSLMYISFYIHVLL